MRSAVNTVSLLHWFSSHSFSFFKSFETNNKPSSRATGLTWRLGWKWTLEWFEALAEVFKNASPNGENIKAIVMCLKRALHIGTKTAGINSAILLLKLFQERPSFSFLNIDNDYDSPIIPFTHWLFHPYWLSMSARDSRGKEIFAGYSAFREGSM